MPTERSVLLYTIDLPARLNICDEQVQVVDNWRKYLAAKDRTLPGDVEIAGFKDSAGNWHIKIFESPDTDHLKTPD
jgi:hypothetical protein